MKSLALAIGLASLALLLTLLYWNPPWVARSHAFFDNGLYDLKVRYFHPQLGTTPIVIVDIDDQSLGAIGRWPWSRKVMAQLIGSLYRLGAKVVATDVLFSEPEANLVEEVVGALGSEAPQGLAALSSRFDYDALLAQSLAQGQSVLAIAFQRKGPSQGLLPAPLLPAGDAPFPNFPHYLANLASLQQASVGAGAINATPDADGVIRSSPLLFRHEEGLYPSLALEACLAYRDALPNIPLDLDGRLLVPFWGGPRTFPYISALDILQGKEPPLQDKLLFIGSSATGMRDLFPTAIAPIFAGIEIHASIAEGLLSQRFIHAPTWGRAASLGLMLGLGLLCAIAFPYLGSVTASLLFFALSGLLLLWDLWMWKGYYLAFSVVEPLFAMGWLYLFNEIFGYSIETHKRKELKAVFGQYLSPAYLDQMLKGGTKSDLMGENKELTVLFADIRNFTPLCEKMSAPELKDFLNRYFTPMTQVIFDHGGTIDKYVGDMIMAFWGAPLPDADHARHAIEAALAMQKTLKTLNLGIQTGIGINTGLMNVGDMGSQFRRAYTVLGDAVNLAARLEQLTKTYTVDILVGETTYQRTKDLFTFKLIDTAQVKGKSQPVPLYQPS